MGISVNDLVVCHWEKQPAAFKAGRQLHDFLKS